MISGIDYFKECCCGKFLMLLKWLEQASKWYGMYSNDLKVMNSKPHYGRTYGVWYFCPKSSLNHKNYNNSENYLTFDECFRYDIYKILAAP